MAATVSISKPFDRCDDVRALRRRFRDLTLSGTTTTGGFTVTAAQVGLSRIFGVSGNGIAAASDQATANPWSYEVSADGQTVTFVLYELGGTGAAGDPLAQKTNSEAVLTGQVLHVEFIGI